MKIGLRDALAKHAYAEYRRRLDAYAVMDYYAAEHCSEVPGADGTTEIMHSCLLDRVEPHHSNGDQNPSACVNVDKKTFVCFAIGYGCDLMHLIAKMEGKDSIVEALPDIEQFLVGKTSDRNAFRAEIEALFAKPGLSPVEIPTYHDRILSPWAGTHPYLGERGITVEAVDKLRLCYDSRENRIVFPHFWEGKLVGWQKRAIPNRPGKWVGTSPDWPKYRSCVPVDTEILTNRGWLYVDDIDSDDLIASVDRSGVVSYGPLLGINRYHHSGDLIKISSKLGDQLVTGNHSVFYRRYGAQSRAEQRGSKRKYVRRTEDSKMCPICGIWKRYPDDYPVFPSGVFNYCKECHRPKMVVDDEMCSVTATDLMQGDFPGVHEFDFPLSAFGGLDTTMQIDSIGGDAVAELLGWILAEGTITDRDVRIYQTKADGVARIEELLILAQVKYSTHIRSFEHNGMFPRQGYAESWDGRSCTDCTFVISKGDPLYIKARTFLGKNKVPPWEWIFLPRDEAVALFEGFRKGDGVKWNRNSTSVYQKDVRVLDFFQALCVRLGWRTKLNETALYVCKRNSVRLAKSKRKAWLSKIDFCGEVWCPTTIDGTWVARRDGHVFVTGNSAMMPKSETLYNFDIASGYKSVIVVESPISVAKAVSLGIDNVVATFGAKVSDRQVELLSRNFDQVFVWFDADPAGRAGEVRLIEHLWGASVRVIVPQEGRDMADSQTQDDILAMVASSVPAVLRLPKRERRGRVRRH